MAPTAVKVEISRDYITIHSMENPAKTWGTNYYRITFRQGGQAHKIHDSIKAKRDLKSISCEGLYPRVARADKLVDDDIGKSWFRRPLHTSDILFTTVGTIAESAIEPEEV